MPGTSLRGRLLALVLRPTAPPLIAGVITAAVLITAEVVLVHLLKRVAPENAFGAVFLLGVLVVSAGWSFGLALVTSLASALAYVWFHVSEGSGSLAPAVVVFLTLALLTNVLVGQARLRALEADQRRREADLSAELARIMLRAADLPAALEAASAQMAAVLEIPYATLTTETNLDNHPDQVITLGDGSTSVGSLLVPAALPENKTERVRRLVPSLEALLSAAREREQINTAVAALAEQQTALRRVATLVARGVDPTDIYPVAVAELARGLPAEHVTLVRYACGTDIEVLAATDINRADLPTGFSAPVTVAGRAWGALLVGSIREPTIPAETQSRIHDFADLVATAISNAETRAELKASRARIVAAADQARRGFERDLHDGAQQRIVSLGLELGAIRATVAADDPELGRQLSGLVDGLSGLYSDLQELSRGIHPAILSRGGLGPAIKTLARRSPVPVDLTLELSGQIPDSVAVAAYYVVAEALTNTAKYAGATGAAVCAVVDDGHLEITVTDDGVGGARPGDGTGLVGLNDRVNTMSGELVITSPVGGGTRLAVTIPLAQSH